MGLFFDYWIFRIIKIVKTAVKSDVTKVFIHVMKLIIAL